MMNKQHKNKKQTLKLAFVFRGVILIFTLTGLAYLLESTSLLALMDESWVDSQIKGQGYLGALTFVGIGTLITAIGLPKQVVCFFSGYAFGFISGTALAILATLFGCIVSFYYSRFLARDFIQSRYPNRIIKIDNFVHENPLRMTLLIRLFPVGSNLLTNLLAGASRVQSLPFFIGSMIGYLPQTLVFALIGSGIGINPVYRIGLGLILFISSSFLGVMLYRKYQHGYSLDIQTDKQVCACTE